MAVMDKQLISLAQDTVDRQDIDKLIGWLQTYPRLTKGPVTTEFEHKWAKKFGSKYAVYVNSGSSANLMMLYALIVAEKLRNKKILVPALSWATDLAPVIQLGLEPILIDCNLQDLSVDIDHLRVMIAKHQPSALLLVSVLGFSPNMDEIVKVCNETGVILLEDNCESLGTSFNNTLLGNFGLMSSFSLYFGHHLSTIEGGIIMTNDEYMNDILRMIRNHGWDRDLSAVKQQTYRNAYDIDEFNALYTFYHPGFNFRATDLQAYLGLGQLDKMDDIMIVRNRNYNLYNQLIDNKHWKPKAQENSFTCNFCYPIIHPKREQIVQALRVENIEVRPLIAGSMGKQPMYTERYGTLELANVSIVDKWGFYVPNHQEMTEDDVRRVCNIVNSVING